MERDLGLPPALTRLRAPPAGPERISSLTSRIGRRLARLDPSLVVALGDVDSTVAGALAAWRLDLPLVHVEAGLRSFEPEMPEERNRILVDGLSDRLYLTEPQAVAHLRAEGVSLGRIRRPGNVMADALHQAHPQILARAGSEATPHARGGYIVTTLHRQANVDDPRRLAGYARALERVAGILPVRFLVHPRTRRRLEDGGLLAGLEQAGVEMLAPRPYLAFLALVSGAALVVTDSGGLQVEAALLGVPCLTLRRRTEHELTLTHGGNRLGGGDPRRLLGHVRTALERPAARLRRPRAWDGHAAERIVSDWVRGFRRPARLPGAAEVDAPTP